MLFHLSRQCHTLFVSPPPAKAETMLHICVEPLRDT